MNLQKYAKKNERGIAMIEYALLITLLALAVYAAVDWTALKTAIDAAITAIVDKITPA